MIYLRRRKWLYSRIGSRRIPNVAKTIFGKYYAQYKRKYLN